MHVTAQNCRYCCQRRGQLHAEWCPSIGATPRQGAGGTLNPSPLVRRIQRRRIERPLQVFAGISFVVGGLWALDPYHAPVYALSGMGALALYLVIFGGKHG